MEKITNYENIFSRQKKHLSITTHSVVQAHCIIVRSVPFCLDSANWLGWFAGADSCIHHLLIACEFIKINIIIFPTNCFFFAPPTQRLVRSVVCVCS